MRRQLSFQSGSMTRPTAAPATADAPFRRSVRQPDHAEITADFMVEDAGAAVVQRTWPDGAYFASDCPVCGRSGALTGQWRRATEQEVARLGKEACATEAAERRGPKPGAGRWPCCSLRRQCCPRIRPWVLIRVRPGRCG
jgi:hypothetical protein